ncbi:MAG: hypothetical protein DI613_19740 [Kocuria rhizophila]|uniref:hypothetical protein n=1 Tax=Micrococcus endophyticus TaxID=455343 RepID=UPI000DB7847B|nr:MAG: hypothetical protein DI613_19740 [Kocuria rhizophila]
MDESTERNAARAYEQDLRQGSRTQTEADDPVTPEQARELLASVPSRPRRRLGLQDHFSALATIALSLISGLLALSGHPWWAIPSAVVAVIVANHWHAGRRQRINEPRLGAVSWVSVIFGVWLVLPIYRGIRFGDTAPFPEALLLGGLAPAAWLVFYLCLLIRR